MIAACTRVDREHLPARRSEAAENGDRIDLAHRERVHAARDADAAEQQRDESDDREIVVQLFDRAAPGATRCSRRRASAPCVPCDIRLLYRATNTIARHIAPAA